MASMVSRAAQTVPDLAPGAQPPTSPADSLLCASQALSPRGAVKPIVCPVKGKSYLPLLFIFFLEDNCFILLCCFCQTTNQS